MGCQNFEEKLHELLDGHLSSGEAGRVTAHLRTCPACTVDFKNLQLIDRSLKGLPLYRVGPTFHQKVLAALTPPVQGKTRLAPWQRRASLVLLLLVSAWLTGFALFLAGRMGAWGMPAHPWISMELLGLKGFLEGVRWVHSARGWLAFLSWEARSSALWLQWAFSSFLAAVLIFFLSGNPHPARQRRSS